ncbi:caspase domain-containing protein [Fusarium flagelliforme]|uniref:caspase domain-containing protein n=1 Tax=Fusarium flagelliforme TaxID=2675880 RepID=UPI001E8DA378|nr:caspase domain-containing protein [Fusarium flagelliforme]KAH7183207.1 caspase domain-containing protein [Fusarium flagelliforme]
MPVKTSCGKKIALLVGVNNYLKADSSTRKDNNGSAVTLDDLGGCENDVLNLKKMLDKKYGITNATIMISSSSPNAKSYQQPTYQNIENAFQKVTQTAQKGDLFFFHFSGHGARLNTTRNPPNGHTKDPSLLPMDFCQGQPAVRGWILNHWLRRLYQKGVEVVVSLDSCYSGGAWRTDGMKRTVGEDWKPPVNLPVDEEQALDAAVSDIPSVERNAVPIDSWGINPYNFTLMAACKSNQSAQECRQADGKICGVFTATLVSHLDSDSRLKTYRAVCAAIKGKFEASSMTQTPMVYGHDRLQFLGTTEPCCAMPLYVRVEKGSIRIPEGKIHGVTRGTEYTRLLPDAHKLVVEDVEDTVSFVKIPDNTQSVWKSGDEIYRSRLSTQQPFRVLVDPILPSAFSEALLRKLEQHLHGPIEVVTASPHEDRSTAAVELKCKEGRIELYKQQSGVDCHTTTVKDTYCSWLFSKLKQRDSGTMERVPGLELLCPKGHESGQPIAPSASAIIHLLRYQQILELRDLAPNTKAPFTVKLMDEDRSLELSKSQKVFSSTKVRLIFQNLSSETLHFTVLVFGPGHHIKQLYPGSESSRRVGPGSGNRECCFRLQLPENLRPGLYKDILRIFVTKTSDVSLKGLELPDIWSEGQTFHSTSSPLRDVRLVEEFEWWIDDFEIWTQDRPGR